MPFLTYTVHGTLKLVSHNWGILFTNLVFKIFNAFSPEENSAIYLLADADYLSPQHPAHSAFSALLGCIRFYGFSLQKKDFMSISQRVPAVVWVQLDMWRLPYLPHILTTIYYYNGVVLRMRENALNWKRSQLPWRFIRETLFTVLLCRNVI